MQTPNKPSPMVKIGGAYKCRRKKDNAVYLSGRFGFGAKILILPNPDKVEGADSKVPDFNIFVVEDTPKPTGKA